MTALVIVLLILALVIGGFALLIEGLKWLLILALALFIASVVAGFVDRRARA